MTVRVSRVCKAAAPISKALSPADRAQAEEIITSALRAGLRIDRAFLDVLDRIRERIDLNRLAAEIERGSIDAAQAMVDRATAEAGFTPFTLAIRETVIGSAEAEAVRASAFRPGNLEVHFDVVNPRTAEFLRQYDMGLIRQLSSEVRNTTRAVLGEGVVAGRNPLTTARDVRASIGLTEHQQRIVANYRRALEQGERNALARKLRDRRFDPSVERHLTGERPLTGEQIDRLVDRYRQRWLKYRSETIARTESLRATHAGQQETWRQAVASGAFEEHNVRRSWVYSHDTKVRPWHATIPSLNPRGRGLEEPFETTHGPLLYPGDPNGAPDNTINCRCTLLMRYVPTLKP